MNHKRHLKYHTIDFRLGLDFFISDKKMEADSHTKYVLSENPSFSELPHKNYHCMFDCDCACSVRR